MDSNPIDCWITGDFIRKVWLSQFNFTFWIFGFNSSLNLVFILFSLFCLLFPLPVKYFDWLLLTLTEALGVVGGINLIDFFLGACTGRLLTLCWRNLILVIIFFNSYASLPLAVEEARYELWFFFGVDFYDLLIIFQIKFIDKKHIYSTFSLEILSKKNIMLLYGC